MSWSSTEGLPFPLGVSWSESDRAYNFAVYSKHATSVRLALFDASDVLTPRVDIALDPRTNKSGRVWHCRLSRERVGDCRYYGYFVDGPASRGPFEQHAFRPQVRLLDPYARTIALVDGAPVGVIEAPRVIEPVVHPAQHEADALIYELHVGHFTRSETSGVSDAARGTFAGVVEKIPYLRELGVTIVELMPVFQSDPAGRDRWGYMPISFFAPDRRYCRAGEDPSDAFRTMVGALHEAGIEVVLDVVYNHTAERDAHGPIFHFKGLDNSTYYLMRDGDYADYSGCGNSINASNRCVRKMIVDSMRHWVRDMGVDGLRFDLASVFARTADGSVSADEPAIFSDIASDPLFDGIRMIAEPWDAAGAYALGRAFPGITWLQWNSRYCEDVRRFVRGDPHLTSALMQRVYGSDDLFPDDRLHAYHAYQSVNYVTSHDGFTLHDLVAYAHKRNSDGLVENWSANNGHEGAGAPPDVVAGRLQQAKNFIALLLLSNGTPMLRAGDELLHTQHGHNNPYDIDDETTWLDWRGREREPGFWRFVQQMIAFRKTHGAIARSRFWREDVRWFGATGVVDFASPLVAWCLHGADGRDLYAMVNAGAAPVTFVLQDNTARPWRIGVDTSRTSPDDVDVEARRELDRPSYTVAARSVVVLVR